MQSKGFKRKKRPSDSIAVLKENTWGYFSKYIRMKHADWRGYVVCITCSKRMFWKAADAGHFVPGRKNIILFDERHVYPQCSRCNRFRAGNWDKYYVVMKTKHGQKVIDELIALNNQEKIWKKEELKALLQKYKSKVGNLEKRVPQYES